MKQTQTGPAVQKALDYITGGLKNGIWAEEQVLPTTRHLTTAIGVSRDAILKAIAILKNSGEVSTIPRGRIRNGTPTDAAGSTAVPTKPVWLMKRASLERDLLSGRFSRQKQLPSLKELQAIYGTCFITMRKILRSMVTDGALQLRGRKYEVVNSSSYSFRERIVFITYDSPILPRSALNQGELTILNLLEQECMRREIRLDIIKVDFYNYVETQKLSTTSVIDNPALGYFVDLWWNVNEDYRRSCLSLLTHLSLLKRPVAILDEYGTFSLPSAFNANAFFQLFTFSEKNAGARMARYLLGMGHASVVYVSSLHHGNWSKQRFTGIVEQYSKAGLGSGVHAAVGENIELTHEHVFAVSGLDVGVIRQILSASYSKSLAQEMVRTFVNFKSHFSPGQISSRDAGIIRANLGVVIDALKRKSSKALLAGVYDRVMMENGKFISSAVRQALFRQALAFSDATAWICANDDTALDALAFLREQGAHVPREISVAGFDNQPVDALEHRLTTFDFNAPAFIHRMLNFITRPPKWRGPCRHSPVEIEGIVMQRDTVGPGATGRATRDREGRKGARQTISPGN